VIKFTSEMIEESIKQTIKRKDFITPNFKNPKMTQEQSDQIGFLGEFACCEFMGIDWKKNIRESYEVIDDFDFQLGKAKFDVKTESVPDFHFKKMKNGQVDDDASGGRRLINEHQIPLLSKYYGVIFGAIDFGPLNKQIPQGYFESLNGWLPLGFITTEYALNNYEATVDRPDGGKYPYAALPIKTSSLFKLELLKSRYQQHLLQEKVEA